MTTEVEIPAAILELARSVARIVREELGADTRVWLFGSWAKGRAAPRSDLDVAYASPREVGPREHLRLDDRLDELPTLRRFDLVDLAQAADHIRSTVQTAGIAL